MTRLTRYILREILTVFLLTLLGMTAVMMLVGVLQEATRHGLGLGPILQVLPYLLPNALRFAIPGTILFAVCSVYGRLSASRELIAIKSLGIHPMVAVWPALVLAFLLSVVAVWINDIAVSWGRQGVRKVFWRSFEQIAYGMLEARRSYSNDQFSITVMAVRGKTLIEPTITLRSTADGEPLVIKASEAELGFVPETGELDITMYNGRVMLGDKLSYRAPDVSHERIPLGVGVNDEDRSPSHLPLRQVPVESARQRRELRRLEQQYAADAAFQLAQGHVAVFAGPAWKKRFRARTAARERLFRLRTAPWRRWANGFSCFFFAMVGVPLAIRLRNADFWTSFGLCFLPILMLYYPLLAFSVDRAKAGDLPPYVVWLGNLVLCGVGLLLMRRVIRY